MRAVALGVHRDFSEVAIVAEGRLLSAGRIQTRPETLELCARSLDPGDRVNLEVDRQCLGDRADPRSARRAR